MQVDSNFVPLARLVTTFCALLLGGIVLTVPLFRFNWRKFLQSSLFIKIMFWVPIFVIFLSTLYMANFARLILLIALLCIALWELVSVAKTKEYRFLLAVYYLFFGFALLHFLFIEISYSNHFINLLITLTFASVLADVTAFFLGNYFGHHKLPEVLNKNKSWEGVSGQILGALLGVLLVNAFVDPVVSIWLFIPIGLGSAAGDLANSFVKRKLAIKDWSKAIPGHGGFIDRLSSLAGSTVFMFYFLKIFRII